MFLLGLIINKSKLIEVWYRKSLSGPIMALIADTLLCQYETMSKELTNLSLSMMVLSLWAMVRTVQSANSVRIVFWMRSSDSKSTAAVASSRINTFVFRSNVRARHTNWRWPTLKSITTVHKIYHLSYDSFPLFLEGRFYFKLCIMYV